MKIIHAKNIGGLDNKVIISGDWVDRKIFWSQVNGNDNGLRICLDPENDEDPDIYLSWVWDGWCHEIVLRYGLLPGEPEQETTGAQLLEFFSLVKHFNIEVLEEADLVLSEAKKVGLFNWFNEVDDEGEEGDENENARGCKEVIDNFKFISLA